MAELSKLVPSFTEFGGNDLRSHDVDRKPRFARSSNNAELADNNSLTARPGQAGIAFGAGGGGSKTYVKTNSDKSVTEEFITIDDNLHRRKLTTLSIAYAGSAENPSYSMVPVLNDDGTYTIHAYLYAGDTELLDEDLGNGLDDTTPVTIAELIIAINAVTDFTATYTGSNATPAAYLTQTTGSSLTSSATAVATSAYWEEVHCPTNDPFTAFWANKNRDAFENACLFNHNNLLFIATGTGPLYKYDGVSTYAAGMPEPASFAAVTNGAGVLTGNYRWFITHDFYDSVGNNIEGNGSTIVAITCTTHQARVTIPNVLLASKYLTSYAYAAGAQTDTTLTVDNGSGGAHSLQAGHTAFFRDNSGVLQERLITARTSTTITIEGTSVTIADNAVISANLRVNLWRNKVGDSRYYLVRTFANDPLTATFTYDDNNADGDLGVQYSAPIGGHAPPREDLRYLTAFQNIMVMSDGNGSQVFISDIDGPEYTAGADADYILVRTKSNQPVKALGANREILCMFKQDETCVLQGDLGAGDFRTELMADAIGCDAHATVADVDGTLWFYSELSGVCRITSNSVPSELSYRVLPAFRNRPRDTEQQYVHKRAVACDFAHKQQYLLWLPCESTSGSDIYANDNSTLFVADYRSQDEEDNDYDKEGRLRASRPKIRWWPFDGFNMGGGVDSYEGDLVWMQRRYSADLGAFQYVHTQQPSSGEETDYTEFGQPYAFRYEAGWDDLGEPDLLKKFIGASIYSFDNMSSPSFDITVSTELDYKNDQTHSQKSLVSTQGGLSLGWGEGPWGDFPWGELEDNRRLFPFLLTKARAVKLVFTGTIWKTRPVVSGWIVEAVPAFRPKQRK